MAIKAVFFDIDGTLMTDTKRVQKSTVKAIKELKNQGILVGLATGRGPAFVAPFMENYGLDFAVTYNGQYVLTRNEVIYANPLPKSTVFKLMSYAQKRRMEVSLGTSSGLVGSGLIHLGTSSKAQVLSHIIPKQWAKAVERSFKHIFRRLRPQNYDKLTLLARETIFQIVVVATTDKTAELEQAFPEITITRSSSYSADLISKGQSKLRGICRLAEHFDFDLYEVMAFGDSDNDMEMLSSVGVGVAMGNAQATLKAIAHHITSDNNTNGIAKALWHYGLIQLEEGEHFRSADDNFNKVKAFHQMVDGMTHEMPRLYQLTEAGHRADFMIEELVEFLHASSQGDEVAFDAAVADLHKALERATDKVKKTSQTSSPLVGQVDALADLLYLTYGSFVLMGVDPKPIVDTIHAANMGKIFPDGQVHRDPITNKVLKPDDWQERCAPEPAIKKELDRQMQKALKHQSRTGKQQK
ncbi:Cof-type HAD-IIB family hydrolase [Streptococcus sp. E17BB]|uniref:Cof-type HAD-IIB family hydrolase n=1 Tax=Streptococcus sp. E17BB TaxID=3278714 RepID=UPI00359E1708